MGRGFEHLGDYASQALANVRAGGVLASAIAVVLVVAGLSKWRAPLPAAQALVDFGIASHVRIWYARVLGGFELMLGLALATSIASATVRSIALGLLSVFTVLVAKAVLRGDRVACRCFGHSDEVVSRSTLVRNGALALSSLLALVIALRSRESQRLDLSVLIAGGATVACWALLGTITRLTRWNSDTRSRLRERQLRAGNA